MNRSLGIAFALLALLLWALMGRTPEAEPYDEKVCAGPPLKTVEARNEAFVELAECLGDALVVHSSASNPLVDGRL